MSKNELLQYFFIDCLQPPDKLVRYARKLDLVSLARLASLRAVRQSVHLLKNHHPCIFSGSWFHSISAICQRDEYILELNIRIQIQINQLLIFIEKFSPLPGFEPQTSRVPSWCATNWAIQAWITSGLDTQYSIRL